jgi:hypothetical protein
MTTGSQTVVHETLKERETFCVTSREECLVKVLLYVNKIVPFFSLLSVLKSKERIFMTSSYYLCVPHVN